MVNCVKSFHQIQMRRSHRSWGVMTPHFSRQRGTGGHNLGIIHIYTSLFAQKEQHKEQTIKKQHISHCSYHVFTLTSTLCRLYPGVWRITPSTIFRLAACIQRNNSKVTKITTKLTLKTQR